MKRIYLVLIIVISLVSLSLYSTYAMFTASVETEDFVELSASILPTETRLQEYKRLTINAGESQSILLTIINSSENNLYYGVWYEMIKGTINDDITIAKLSSSTNKTSGSINMNETRYVKVVTKIY